MCGSLVTPTNRECSEITMQEKRLSGPQSQGRKHENCVFIRIWIDVDCSAEELS